MREALSTFTQYAYMTWYSVKNTGTTLPYLTLEHYSDNKTIFFRQNFWKWECQLRCWHRHLT